jgi:hypothetical protein
VAKSVRFEKKTFDIKFENSFKKVLKIKKIAVSTTALPDRSILIAVRRYVVSQAGNVNEQ